MDASVMVHAGVKDGASGEKPVNSMMADSDMLMLQNSTFELKKNEQAAIVTE